MKWYEELFRAIHGIVASLAAAGVITYAILAILVWLHYCNTVQTMDKSEGIEPQLLRSLLRDTSKLVSRDPIMKPA